MVLVPYLGSQYRKKRRGRRKEKREKKEREKKGETRRVFNRATPTRINLKDVYFCRNLGLFFRFLGSEIYQFLKSTRFALKS